MITYFVILGVAVPYALAATQCSNIPPFLSRLRDGVDITQLDLLPIDAGRNDGFRNPLFDFTCDLGVTKTINGVSIKMHNCYKYDILRVLSRSMFGNDCKS